MGEETVWRVGFYIPTGLDKPYYERFRALRKKFRLSDKGMVECMVLYVLRQQGKSEIDILGDLFDDVVREYLENAPPNVLMLPEVK